MDIENSKSAESGRTDGLMALARKEFRSQKNAQAHRVAQIADLLSYEGTSERISVKYWRNNTAYVSEGEVLVMDPAPALVLRDARPYPDEIIPVETIESIRAMDSSGKLGTRIYGNPNTMHSQEERDVAISDSFGQGGLALIKSTIQEKHQKDIEKAREECLNS
jgi:hypothetical protein